MPNTQLTQSPNKRYDMLALSAKNQSANASDFLSSGIDASNMYLKSPEEYKRDPNVRNSPLFTDLDGRFDTKKFDMYYEKAALTSAALIELLLESIIRLQELNALDINDIEYDPSKIARKYKVLSAVIRDLKTPTTTGISTVFKDLSTEEIAQKNTILNKDGSKKSVSANDMGFWGSMFSGKTYALAQWDSDGYHTLSTGIKVQHKKGELRLDDSGNPMYEDITGKATWNRNTLRPFDVITKDDGLGDRWKFWDLDSLEKSWQQILIPTALKIAPMFIPGVGQYYGVSTAVWNTAKLGVAVTEDSDRTNSFRNAASGWFKKFEFNGISMDNEVDNAFFSLNSLSGLVGDVVVQNAQQRGIAQTIQKFRSRGNQLTKPLQAISKLHSAAYAKEFAGRSFADDVINNTLQGSWVSKVDAKMLAQLAAKTTAAMASASNWSKGYMVLTQALGMDPELRDMGLSWYERSIAMALAGAGFAAIMSTDLGEIALRGLGFDDVEKAVLGATLPLINKMKTSLVKISKEAPEAQRSWFKGMTSKIVSGTKRILSQDNILSSAVGEAIEESTEQIVENLATLAAAAISPTAEFNKSFGDILEEIGQAAFGGAIGGAVFMASDPGRRKHLLNFKKAVGQDNFNHLIMLAANGYTSLAITAVDKMKGKTGLSQVLSTEVVTDKDKKTYFKGTGGDYSKSHEGVVLESLKNFIKGISTIINEESLISSFGVDEDTKRMKEYVAELITSSEIGKTMYSNIADVLSDTFDAYIDYTSATDAELKNQLKQHLDFQKDRYARITGSEAVNYYTNMLAFGLSNGLSMPFYTNNVVSFAARFGENYYALSNSRLNYYNLLFKKYQSNQTISLELAFDQFSKLQNNLGNLLDNIFNWTGKDVSEGVEVTNQNEKAREIIANRLTELLRKYTEDGNKADAELAMSGGVDISTASYNGEEVNIGSIGIAEYLAGKYILKSPRSKSVVLEIIDNLKLELSNNGINPKILDNIDHQHLANMLVSIGGKDAKSLDDILDTVGDATYESLVNLTLEQRNSFFQLLANLQELTAETRSTEIAEVDAILEKYKFDSTDDEIVSKTNLTYTTSSLSKDDMVRQWLLEQDTIIDGKTAKLAVDELLLAKYLGGYSLDDISAIRSAGGLSKFFRMKNNHLIISTANKIIAMAKSHYTPFLTVEAMQTLRDILPVLRSMNADKTASDMHSLEAVGNVEFERVGGKFTGNAWLKNNKNNKFGILPADISGNPTAEIVNIEGTDSFLYKVTAKYKDGSGTEHTIEYYLTLYGYILTTINGEYLDLKVDTISLDVVRVKDSLGYSYIRSAGTTLMYTTEVKPIKTRHGDRLTSYDIIKDTSTGKEAIYNSVDNRVVAYLEEGDSFSHLVLGEGYKYNYNNIPASNVIFTIHHDSGTKSVIDGFGRQHVVKYAGNIEFLDDNYNYDLVLHKSVFDEAGNETFVLDSRKSLLIETSDHNVSDEMDIDDTITEVLNLLTSSKFIDLPTIKIIVEMYKERFGDDISEYIILLDGKIKSIDDLIKFKEVVSDEVIRNLESVLQLVLAGLFSLVTDATTPFTAVLKRLNFDLPKSTDKYMGLTRQEAELLAKDMSDMFNKIHMVKILGSAGGLNALDETYNISTKSALAFIKDVKDSTGSLSVVSDIAMDIFGNDIVSSDDSEFVDNLYNFLQLNPSSTIDEDSYVRIQNILTKILDTVYKKFNDGDDAEKLASDREAIINKLSERMSLDILNSSFTYSSLDYSLATDQLDAKVMLSMLRAAITTSWSDVALDFKEYAQSKNLVYSPVQALNAFMALATITQKEYFDASVNKIFEIGENSGADLTSTVKNLQLIIGGAGSGKTSVVLDFLYKTVLNINNDISVRAIAIDENKKDNYINHLGIDKNDIFAMNPFVESILNEDGRALYKAFILLYEESLEQEKKKTSKIDVDKLREYINSVEHGGLKLSDLVIVSEDNNYILSDLSKLFTEEFVDSTKVPNILFIDEYTQVPVYVLKGLSNLNMLIICSGDPTQMCGFVRFSNNREWVLSDSFAASMFTSQQFRATNNISATNFSQLYKINSTYLTVKEPFVNKIISDGLSLIRFSHYFDSENNLYGVHQHTGATNKVDPKLVLAVKNMISEATERHPVVVITPELGNNSYENENFLPKEIREILDSNKDVVKYEPVSKSLGMTYKNVIIGNALDGSSLYELSNTEYSEESPSSYRLATLSYKRLNTAITRASKAAIIFNYSDKTSISQDLFREAKILSSIDTLAISNELLGSIERLEYSRNTNYKPSIDSYGMSKSSSSSSEVNTPLKTEIVLKGTDAAEHSYLASMSDESRVVTEPNLNIPLKAVREDSNITINAENIEELKNLIVDINGLNIFRFKTYPKNGLFNTKSPVVVANINGVLVPFIYTKVKGGGDLLFWKPFVSINKDGIPQIFDGNDDILRASQTLSENLNLQNSTLSYKELMEVLGNFGFHADEGDINVENPYINRLEAIELLKKLTGIDTSDVEAVVLKAPGVWEAPKGKISHADLQKVVMELIDSTEEISADEGTDEEVEESDREEEDPVSSSSGNIGTDEATKDKAKPDTKKNLALPPGKRLIGSGKGKKRAFKLANDSDEKAPGQGVKEFNCFHSSSGFLFDLTDENFDPNNRWKNLIKIPNKDLAIAYDKFNDFLEFKTEYTKLLRASYFIFRMLSDRNSNETISDYIKRVNISDLDILNIIKIIGITVESGKSAAEALSDFLENADEYDVVVNVVATGAGMQMESGIAGGTEGGSRIIELALRVNSPKGTDAKFITLGKFDDSFAKKFFGDLPTEEYSTYLPNRGEKFKLATITDKDLINTVFDSDNRVLKINIPTHDGKKEAKYSTLKNKEFLIKSGEKSAQITRFTPLSPSEYVLTHPWHVFLPIVVSTDRNFILTDQNGKLITSESIKNNPLMLGVPFGKALSGEKDLMAYIDNNTYDNSQVLVRFDRDNIKSFSKLCDYMKSRLRESNNRKSLLLQIPDTLVPKLLSTYQRAYTNNYFGKNVPGNNVSTLPSSILNAIKKTYTSGDDILMGILLTTPEYASMHSHLFSMFKTIASSETFNQDYFDEGSSIKYNKELIENCLKYLFNDSNFSFATLLNNEDYKTYLNSRSENQSTTEYKTDGALHKLKTALNKLNGDALILLVNMIFESNLNSKDKWSLLNGILAKLGLSKNDVDDIVNSFRQFTSFISDTLNRFVLVVNETVVYSNNDIAAGLISAGVVANVTNGAAILKNAFMDILNSIKSTDSQFLNILTRMFDDTNAFFKNDLGIDDVNTLNGISEIIDNFFKRDKDNNHTFFLYNNLTEFAERIAGTHKENSVGGINLTTSIRVIETFPTFSDTNFESLFTKYFTVGTSPLKGTEDGAKSKAGGKQTSTGGVQSLNAGLSKQGGKGTVLGEFNFDSDSQEEPTGSEGVGGGVGPKITYDLYMEGAVNVAKHSVNKQAKLLASNLINVIPALLDNEVTIESIRSLFDENPNTIGYTVNVRSMNNFGKALMDLILDSDVKEDFLEEFKWLTDEEVNNLTTKCI